MIKKINQNILFNKLKYRIDSILLFLFFLVVYSIIVFFSSKFSQTDYYTHVEHIISINKGVKDYPSNFLFYYITNLFSCFNSNKLPLYTSLIFLLSISTIFKYEVSKNIIKDFLVQDNFFLNEKAAIIISIICFFIYAIPDPFLFLVHKRMYLGKFVPTVWHNSTSILLSPFVLLLFWRQLKLIIGIHLPNYKNILIILFLVIINILIKPSFIFVYIPATFILILKNFYDKKFNIKELLLSSIPLTIGLILIIIMSSLTYFFQYGSIQEESSSIGIKLFYFYKLFYPLWYLLIAMLFSLALPIMTMLFYPSVVKFKPFIYSILLVIFSLLISFIFIENGPRLTHGNFIWQNVFTIYLLFLTNLIFLYNKFKEKFYFNLKNTILLILLLCHFISGFLYLFKYILIENYS